MAEDTKEQPLLTPALVRKNELGLYEINVHDMARTFIIAISNSDLQSYRGSHNASVCAYVEDYLNSKIHDREFRVKYKETNHD